VVCKKTSIVAARECLNKLKGIDAAGTKGVAPGDKISVQGLNVDAVAAYNTNKKFHPKADGKVGFVFTVSEMRVYHAGDTDDIPEMSNVKPQIAMVPVSGTYVMTAQEAAKAVNEKIRPTELAIPMHYGTIVGNEHDAMKFKELVTSCRVQILDRE
jgi:L-ascorbate metabolism protein UlaG (beta-lactamase superfamily)